MSLKVSEQLSEKLANSETAPPLGDVGLMIVDTLCELTLQHRAAEAAALAVSVANKPAVANSVIAMAVGVICSAEINLRRAQETVGVMETDDPAQLQNIRQFIADQMGIPVEEVRTK